MAAGNLYPRWLPYSFEELGSPAFFFYPPISFWIAGAFDALGLSTLAAINATALLVLFASGVTMYIWLKGRSQWPMLWAAAYIIAPYHLMDFYVRGALAEFAAFAWLPLIALAIERMPDRRALPLLALSYCGLILTHLPTAMLAGIFLIAPLAIRKLWQDPRALVPLAASGLFAFSLSAFFLLPALTLQDEISSSMLWTSYFSPSTWTFFASGNRLSDPAVYFLGFGLIALSWSAYSFWTVVTVGAALAAMGLVPFIWEIEPLTRAQFPWRLLAIVEFAAITAIATGGKRSRGYGVALVLISCSYLIWGVTSASYLSKELQYDRWVTRYSDAAEYLPKDFDLSLLRNGLKRTPDLRQWEQLSRSETISISEAGTVTFRRAAFPIWKVFNESGKEIAYHGPVIQFQAEPGTYSLQRVYLWQETIGAIITLFSAVGLIISSNFRRRSSLPRT
ncbi:integral membrane-like protein [Altererythrobacter aurantiacus]|uniref:Integral membrane-like protein n=1 Tax=Parapontixanthobacter aurantiacus TaxID=1463599 RepID=A0A844Z9H7_9SPHN|nr:integral membrane-like protein [Parapontixanthobacter aurantiacus]MXO84575.1 integral membrane-like protein [Parapontixanthobacter aurantiacus]